MTVDGLNGGMFLYLITQQSKHRTGVSVSAWFKPTSSVKYLMDVSDVIYCSMRGSRTTSEPGSSADFGKKVREEAAISCNYSAQVSISQPRWDTWEKGSSSKLVSVINLTPLFTLKSICEGEAGRVRRFGSHRSFAATGAFLSCVKNSRGGNLCIKFVRVCVCA